MSRVRYAVLVVAYTVLAAPVLAQESASYKVEGSTFDAGGSPDGATVLSSPSFRITLHSVGESLAVSGLIGPSYTVAGGLGASYPPPGEVTGLVFLGPATLGWQAGSALGGYNLYRGAVGGVGGTYGDCSQAGLSQTQATVADPVPAGAGFFYLVTAENLLGEEGVRGFASDGTARVGVNCP